MTFFRLIERLIQCLMSNQYGNYASSKTDFDGQCVGQKTQILRVSYEHTYTIELKLHI